jgi:predicted alpha/beta-fold hydrolase
MPISSSDNYRPPFYLFNRHLQTLTANRFRYVRGFNYVRQRLTTDDNDFVDLDWSISGGDRVAVLVHGLEGSSQRPYVRGMVRALNRRGWDAVALNLRGCSGELNWLPRFYHAGATDDLSLVVQHLLGLGRYFSLALVGYSLGGNIVLKYLGEQGDQLAAQLKSAVVYSVPCDLKAGAERMAAAENRAYLGYFMRPLREKVRRKAASMPGRINAQGVEALTDFRAFDDVYTAPLNGFRDAEEYWRCCSSRQFLPAVRRPTLILTARNDPFLAPACYPTAEAAAHPLVWLETPQHGGHVGFPVLGAEYWSETRGIQFIMENL